MARGRDHFNVGLRRKKKIERKREKVKTEKYKISSFVMH